MRDKEKKCIYFTMRAKKNTDRVVEAVGARLEGEDIDTVVVASTTDKTALRFSERLTSRTTIISVAEAPLMTSMGYNGFRHRWPLRLCCRSDK